MAAFMLGWAGVSVHCQVMAFLGDSGLSLRTYLVGKALHGGLSAVIWLLLAGCSPWSGPVSVYLAQQTEAIAHLDFHTGPHHLRRGRLGGLAGLSGPGRLCGEKKQWKNGRGHGV